MTMPSRPALQDLDDALHCNVMDDGNVEVGVHIADVSYFVKAATALDETARSRATSVYLTQKVVIIIPCLHVFYYLFP